ncbi:hypothetical protein Tco_1452939 [Tanacetum coccineum]
MRSLNLIFSKQSRSNDEDLLQEASHCVDPLDYGSLNSGRRFGSGGDLRGGFPLDDPVVHTGGDLVGGFPVDALVVDAGVTDDVGGDTTRHHQ